MCKCYESQVLILNDQKKTGVIFMHACSSMSSSSNPITFSDYGFN